MRWGTGYILGSKSFGPFGLDAPAAFGHTGLIDIAMWADPERDLAAAVVSSGKPGGHPEAKRYPGGARRHRRGVSARRSVSAASRRTPG